MDAESKESKELGKPVGPWECDDTLVQLVQLAVPAVITLSLAFSVDRAAGASVSAARGGWERLPTRGSPRQVLAGGPAQDSRHQSRSPGQGQRWKLLHNYYLYLINKYGSLET